MTGKDKKMNYPIIKHLRINEKQNANWDYKKVRAFLDGKFVDTEILKKLLVKFIDLEVKLEDLTELEHKRIMEMIKEWNLI